MKASHILALMQNDYTTLGVIFADGGKIYTYKALLKDEVKVGDLVIIESKYANFDYTVGKVVFVDETADIDTSVNYDYKWIVGKLDLTRYSAILEVQTRFEKHIRNAQKKQVQRQAINAFLSEFAEGSQERADMEMLLTSGQSLEQIERMLSNGTDTSNTSTNNASTGAGAASGS